jgi:methyl-accepting chemotaxis protein
MRKWNDLRLGVKLIIGFLIVILFTGVVGFAGINTLITAGENSQIVQKSDSLANLILETRKSEKEYLIQGDIKTIEVVKQNLQQARDIVNVLQASYNTNQTEQVYTDLMDNINKYEAAFTDYVSKSDANAQVFMRWKNLGDGFNNEIAVIRKQSVKGDEVYLQADTLESAFLLQRVKGIYFIKNRGDAEWKDLQSAFNNTQLETQKLVSLTSPSLVTSASGMAIQQYIKDYAAQGDQYYANVLSQRADDVIIADTANKIQGSADPAVEGYGGSALLSAMVKQDTEAAQKNAMIIIIALVGGAIAVSILITIVTVSGITKPINRIKVGLNKIAQGDITEKIMVTSHDEVGQMAKSYSTMQENLSSLVSRLKTNSRQLSSSSDQLAMAVQRSGEATQQVAVSSEEMAKSAQEQSSGATETAKSILQLNEAIAQLSKGTSEQSDGVHNIVEGITSVSQMISTCAQNADQAALGARQAARSAMDGTEKARLTLTGMEKIKDSSAAVAGKIEELGSRSAEIGKIVAVIEEIASQTNLLALNAAIEAARAGEQGRGFAVVSDEVRKLAERTATATKEIAELIASVQKGVDEAIKVTAAGHAAVSEGYEVAIQAGKSLEDILKAAKEVDKQIEQISFTTRQVNGEAEQLVIAIESVGKINEQNAVLSDQMTASAAQVSKTVETVAGIAEENSASTEQVSASAQEMSAQIQEIVASSQTMKDMAASLEQSIAAFKTASGEELVKPEEKPA